MQGAKWTIISDSYSKGTVGGFGGNSKMQQDVSRRAVTASILMGAWGLGRGFRKWGNVKLIWGFRETGSRGIGVFGGLGTL